MHTSLSLGRAPAAIPSLHAVGDWLGRIFRHWRTNARAKQARAAFLTMPDHILRDIGVSRPESLAPSARAQASWGNRW